MTDNRIKYGEEKRVNFKGEICHDCGVKRGELHKSGCDVEECLYCGTQKISCDCEDITNTNKSESLTPSQILKEGLERFDNIFNALGFDHVTTCGCFGECDCKSPREKLKSFLITHTLNLLEAERERIENILNYQIVKSGEVVKIGWEDGYKDAALDRLSHLDEEIKKIKELM